MPPRGRKKVNPSVSDVPLNGSDVENDIDEDELYGNMDDLRQMVGDSDDHSFSDLEIDSDRDDDRDYLDNDAYDESVDSGKDSLLAEFSDYEQGSDEDDEQNFMDAIREANNFKVKNRKKKKNGKIIRNKRDRVLDPEVADLLSRANEAFVRNDLQVAEGLYNEIIKMDPRNFAAYETLGDIYQLQGRLNDCCNSWFLAAHINSSDWEFWKIVAILSADLEHYRQAIYCFSRVININHEEWECVYRRATLYKKIGQLGKALEGFQKLYKNHPYDANFLRELAILYVDYDKVDEAIELYKSVYDDNIHRRWAIENAMENAMDSSSSESDEESEEDEDTTDSAKKNKKGKKKDEEIDEDELPEEHLEEMEMFPEINWKRINKKYRCIPFDWSSLNIVAELYLKSPLGGANGIKAIKAYARWIEKRENQTFWNDVADDSEYDMRRIKNSRYDALPTSEKDKSYTLPIDIRVRLGLLRLSHDNFTEAMNQFQFLYDENFEDTADLHFEVAVSLTKAEKFQEATDFFLPLSSIEDFQNVQLFECLGKCYKDLENYEAARDNYEQAIKLDPSILENKLDLAEVYYHLGNNEKFKLLLNEVTEIRKEQDAALYGSIKDVSTAEEKKQTDTRDKSSKPLLEDSMFRQYNSKRKKTPQDIEREKIDRERKITTKVVDKYKSLEKYEEGIVAGDDKLIVPWIDTVSDLIDVFSSIKNFFVRNRSRKFVGIIRRTKKFNTVLDYQLERLSKLSGGDNLSDGLPLMEERVTLTSTTELRGLTYDQWFELFMNLSLTLTKYQSVEDGLSIIETAQEVNVFIQNPERAKMMKFVNLAIVLEMNKEEEISESLRGLLNQYQFNRKVFEIFMLSLSHGQMSTEIISSTVQQKFFLRQIKAFDSVRFNTHVNGQASITNKEVVNPDNAASPYLYYIYAVLLYSSRGFLSALQYLTWLEKDTPDDPMVNLLMGLCHTHRSMQRLTANRHFQFLHGLRYLYRYYDIRSTMYTELESQEADYNLGRAFHLMGLTTIAIAYYNKVLADYKDDKLKKHAAYNSILIYQNSGNIELANHIMEKYLSI